MAAARGESDPPGDDDGDEDDPLAFLQLAGDSEDDDAGPFDSEGDEGTEEQEDEDSGRGDGMNVRSGRRTVLACYPGKGRVCRPDGSSGW